MKAERECKSWQILTNYNNDILHDVMMIIKD